MIKRFFTFFLTQPRYAALAIGAGSAALIATVYYFQLVLLILPCELCYWQRKPHFILIGLAALAFFAPLGRRAWWILIPMLLAALSNVGISIFHVGVENHWWEGLTTCAAPTAITTTIEEARKLIFQSTVVPCDKAGWVFMGISMAGWNGLISLGMALWLGLAIALRRRA